MKIVSLFFRITLYNIHFPFIVIKSISLVYILKDNEHNDVVLWLEHLHDVIWDRFIVVSLLSLTV